MRGTLLRIRDRTIDTVAVIDDDEQARQTRGYLLSDMGVKMLNIAGPLDTVENANAQLATSCEAFICDHHLRTHAGYAEFLGAELVAHAISTHMPAILCTRYSFSEATSIRPLLPNIPVLLSPGDLGDPSDLEDALDRCIAEIEGEFVAERRRWRTQLVVEDVGTDGTFFAAFPGWDADEVIRLRHTDVPDRLRKSIKIGFRTHVKANLGEERPERFFVSDWQSA